MSHHFLYHKKILARLNFLRAKRAGSGITSISETVIIFPQRKKYPMSTQSAQDQQASTDAIEGPIVPTFFKYLVPSLVGLIAMTSASLVDGFFIGNYVGVTALAAQNSLTKSLAELSPLSLTG